MVYTEAMSSRTLTRLQQLVRDRRRALKPPVSQTEFAKQCGFTYPAMLCMVENGDREFTLEQLLRVADALRLKRVDLIKLWLFEQKPQVYKAVWGGTDPFDAETEGSPGPRQKAPSPFDEAFMARFHSLPRSARNSLCVMLDELCENTGVPAQSSTTHQSR
jgi:hypothetical protein